MTNHFKAGLVAATAAALLALPSVSMAAFASSDTAGDLGAASPLLLTGIAPPQRVEASASPLASAALAQALDEARTAASAAATSPFPTVQALGATAHQELKGNAELMLWNLCAMIRAHGAHNSFDRLDTGIESVKIREDIVSAVPLPGSFWMMLSGVLALAGPRLRSAFAKLRRRAAPSGVLAF